VTASDPQSGYCVRVVPAEVAAGHGDDWLAAHRQHHTPAVRRQPGFISKVIMQSEENPLRMVMLLTWRTAADAQAWVAKPEHDVTSARINEFSSRTRIQGADRGGYRIVEAAIGQ
jgi:heme-degrading monooxygenase HmoA